MIDSKHLSFLNQGIKKIAEPRMFQIMAGSSFDAMLLKEGLEASA